MARQHATITVGKGDTEFNIANTPEMLASFEKRGYAKRAGKPAPAPIEAKAAKGRKPKSVEPENIDENVGSDE